MAKPAVYNTEIDKEEIYVFDLEFANDEDVYQDVSTWEFNFTLKNKLGDVIWEIQNADFTRPFDYEIYFEKSVAEVGAVDDGNYTISLLATNDEWTDNEILIGTWSFQS